MLRRLSRLGVLVAAVAANGLLSSHPLSAQSTSASSPTFRSETESVEVGLIVTDREGRPVGDLTRDDFRVLEDGKPQNLVTLVAVDNPSSPADSRSPEEHTAPDVDVQSNARRSDGRLYVIVLDALHVDATRSQRVQQAAQLFIDRYVHANDMAAVIVTGRSSGAQVLTTNKALLREAAAAFLGRKLQSATLARNERYANEQAIVNAARAQGGAAPAARVTDPYDEERAQNARALLAALRSAGEWFGAVHGRRKSLVLFSEGIDYDLDDVIRPAASGGPPSAATAIASDIRDTITATAGANVSIYAIDPAGLASVGEETIAVAGLADQGDPGAGIGASTLAREMRLSQDSLRRLADDSGGFAFVNGNDAARAFERIVRENSAYYELVYYTSRKKPDGRFHRIDVTVNRPGLTVRARRGYVSATERATRRQIPAGLSPELFDALQSPLPVFGLSMRLFAAPFMGASAGGEASVVVGLELDGGDLSLDPGSRIDLALMAVDTRARVFGPFRDTLTLNLRPETLTSVQHDGVRLLKRLDLPAGRYQLRAAARDRQTNLVGSVLYDLDVPDFNREQLAISGPLLASRDSAAVMTVRPDQRLAAVLSAPPTGVRTFEQNDEITVFLEIYDRSVQASRGLEVVTSVLTSDGETVTASRDARAPTASSGVNVQYDFVKAVSLSAIAPGDYVLLLEVRSPSAGARPSATRRLRFRVVPAVERPVLPPTLTAGRTPRPDAVALDLEYLATIGRYQRGDVQGAIGSLAAWPPERIRIPTRSADATALDVRQVEAAVMLHSDVAMFVAAADPRLSRQQLAAARAWAATLPDDGPGGFRQRWQAYAVGASLIQHDLRAASSAVQESVGRYPGSADLLLMQGAVTELGARSETADFRGTWTVSGGINRLASPTVARIEDALVAAANAYERALALNPSLVSARLRLGWVYGINHSNAHAREQLRRVLDGAAGREARYLAHLFLGGLADSDGDLAGAYDEYEAAHAIYPDAQSAAVALMRTARLAGHAERQAQLFAQYQARATATEDPWWYFAMGFDTDLVAWLHERVTAP